MISEGQARKYCYEDLSLIENYELAIADKTQTWHCHHRVAIIMNCTRKELIAKDCYENRPAHDLIFLTKSKHMSMHASMQFKGNKNRLGKKHTEDTKQKISNACKGQHLTPEQRERQLLALRSPELRAKNSAAHKGNKYHLGKKHTDETKKIIAEKTSIAFKGMKFWNNGTVNKRAYECPGPEWKSGMIPRKKKS